MSLSMYQISIPVCDRTLKNLSHILEKGEESAESRGFDVNILFSSRLAPDMFPLSRQVQIASDIAKGCGARLAGMEVPAYEDDESSYTDLYGRIDKTLKFLGGLEAGQIDGSEDRAITLQLPNTTLNFCGRDYLLTFVMPNLYFHVTTAYNILRHNGVDVGKLDFLGTPPAQ